MFKIQKAQFSSEILQKQGCQKYTIGKRFS